MTSSVSTHSGLEMVLSLVDVDRRDWDVGRVRNTFLPHEVELILSIPISARLPCGVAEWPRLCGAVPS